MIFIKWIIKKFEICKGAKSFHNIKIKIGGLVTENVKLNSKHMYE